MEEKANESVFPRVFYRVVEQNHHHLLDGGGGAEHIQPGLYFGVKPDAVFKADAFKGQRTAFGRFAQIEGHRFLLRAAVVMLGKIEHLVDELGHPLGLLPDIDEPLFLLRHRGVAVGQHDIGIGGNHGQRRFQLVRHIRDKLLLLLPGFFNRRGGDLGHN